MKDHYVAEIINNEPILIYEGTLDECLTYFRKNFKKKTLIVREYKSNTSGSERRDLQIQQIRTTQKIIPNKKKTYKTKHKDESTFFE